MKSKLTTEELEKLQVASKLRHANKPKPVKIVKVKKIKRKSNYKQIKQWEQNYIKEKQSQIKAIAERINKSLGI